MKAKELAQLTGVDKSVISRFLNGKQDLRLRTIEKMSDRMGIKSTTLLRQLEQMKSERLEKKIVKENSEKKEPEA